MKPFDESLQNFTADVAYVKSVRHLYDLGLSTEEIVKQCTYPVTEEKVCKVIDAYEKEKQSERKDVTFVEVTDAYGRKSFKKVSVKS